MGQYVPADWKGATDFCETCGRDAPDFKRKNDRRECSRCFIGRVLLEVASEQEARELRAEMGREIRKPSLPWGPQ